MTRHQRFGVRVAPEVERQTRRLARKDRVAARQLIGAQDRLAREGTRAMSAKKLKSLDLWEIPAAANLVLWGWLAVGAMVVKTVRRLPMTQLKRIERACHRWRHVLEGER